MRLLRTQGRYGPELREVLPALTVLVLVACGAFAALTAAYRHLGAGVLMAAAALVAVVVPVTVVCRRPRLRRRLGYYTPHEIAELDPDGLALAVCHMLRRDGWTARRAPGGGVRPRVRARRADGPRLEVAFRPVAEPLPDEDPPHRRDREPPLRLVVHRGTFGARDTAWARARPDTRLVDGALLSRWAHGTPLDRLIDLTDRQTPPPG
ncbi:hypothetical protein [Streptomyces flavalbus]|uniref:Restriction endonuclease n=1 Tax=Streptomyces flavalbus TaxID=2665155 RepID=A0ABW2WLZ1_9ACTN